MEIRSLEFFRAVAETGSVAAAADVVNSVPSNVSVRLRRLEEEGGAPLFTRTPRGMQLTPAGEMLLDYAQRILALTAEAQAALAELHSEGGSLRLAAMECAAAVRLPGLLRRYHAAWPKVNIALASGTTDSIIQMVLARQVDWGFAGGPVAHEQIAGGAVFHEELVLAVPAAITSVAETAPLSMLGFPHGCAYRARTEAWGRRQGRVTGVAMEFGTSDGLLGCIAAGMGFTILPRSMVEMPRWLGSISGLKLDGAEAQAEIWLVHHRDAPLTRAMTNFYAIVAEAAQAEAEALARRPGVEQREAAGISLR